MEKKKTLHLAKKGLLNQMVENLLDYFFQDLLIRELSQKIQRLNQAIHELIEEAEHFPELI